jgi:hypothetical protein
MRRRSLITTSLALLACAGSVGCGGFGGDDVTQRVTEPALVSKKQVERQPAGSPQRALLMWWRALQYKNAVEAVGYFSASLHMTPRRVSRYIQAADSSLVNRPLLVDEDTVGDKAIVRVLMERITKNPNGRLDRERKAQGFNLVREGGSWKLADNLYLGGLYRVYRAFTAPLRQKNAQK